MSKLSTASAVVLSLIVGPALAQERFPPAPPAKYDNAQKKAAEDFLVARKRPV